MAKPKELTQAQRLDAARKDIHKLAAAAAAAAANDPVALRELPPAYRTVAGAFQTKVAAMCIAAAEVEALAMQLCTAWADCLNAQDGGFLQ